MKSIKIQKVIVVSLTALSISAILFPARMAAADPHQDLEDCRSISGDVVREACLAAAQDQMKAAGLTSDSVLKSTVPDAPVSAPQTALDNQGSIVHDDEGVLLSVSSKVIEVHRSSLGHVTATLANGQSWRVSESRIQGKVGEMGHIRRGRFGGYFLRIGDASGGRAIRLDEDKLAPRVAQARLKETVAAANPDAVVTVQEDKSWLSRVTGRKRAGKVEVTRTSSGAQVTRDAEGIITSVASTVTKVHRNSLGHTTATLANGQRWRVTERRLQGKAGQVATISRGRFGGYFLRIGEASAGRAVRLDSDVPAPSNAAAPAVASAPVRQDPDFGKIKQGAVSQEDFGRAGPSQAQKAKQQTRVVQTVSNVVTNPRKMFVVTLANGQVWQQIEGRLKVKEGDTVVIKQAAMGSHLLHIEGSGRSVRVRRVD